MNDKLLIGECKIGETWYPVVYAREDDNLIMTYPESHTFKDADWWKISEEEDED
jgi:hypothetical protein